MLRNAKLIPRRASDGSFHPLTNEGAYMFTRVVELTSKSGKAKELANTINEKVVPILKKQRGLVDETVSWCRTRNLPEFWD
jgi:hypothetical protein